MNEICTAHTIVHICNALEKILKEFTYTCTYTMTIDLNRLERDLVLSVAI